jgi:hypothetical protein
MVGYIDTAIVDQAVIRAIEPQSQQTSGQLHRALNQALRLFGISFVFAADVEYTEFEPERGIVWGLTDYDGRISVATSFNFSDHIRANRDSVINVATEVIKHEFVHRVQMIENRMPRLNYNPEGDRYWSDPIEVEAYAHQAIAELEHSGYSLDDIVDDLQHHRLSDLKPVSYTIQQYSALSFRGHHEAMSLLVKYMISGCQSRCNHDYLFY